MFLIEVNKYFFRCKAKSAKKAIKSNKNSK